MTRLPGRQLRFIFDLECIIQVDAICKKLVFIIYGISRLKRVLASHILRKKIC